jgi:oxalate decarboxylase
MKSMMTIITEWLYILSGYGRATAFSGGSTARTFDFQTGDTGVFPISYGHYVGYTLRKMKKKKLTVSLQIKNLSPTEPLIYLEVFKAPKFVDFSATQW